MGFQLTATQQAPLSVDPRDKKGNPAPIEGGVWTTDNSDLFTLAPDAADPKQCTVIANGPLGTAKVFFSADADTGEGVKPIIGELEITVTAGEASVLAITAGTATEQP